MSFEGLQERLSALQETTNQLKELIERLATLKFQPGSLPLGIDDENNVAAELGGEINQVLREEEEDLEVLQEEIIDLRSGRPGSESEHKKARLKDSAARLDQELKSCRTSFRGAQLAARESLELARRVERDLMLASFSASALNSPHNRSGASSPGPNPLSADGQSPQHPPALFTARDRKRAAQQRQRASSQANSADAEVTASGDLTAALRRTHELISTEVARSAFAAQVLRESTSAMEELQQRYGGLEDMLASSRDLLGTLLRSQKSDTWYLETALYALLATLAWLVFRRFLYGPMWWIVWLPVRTAWRTGKAVSSMGGSGAGDGARMEVVQPGMEGQKVVGVGEDGAVPTAEVGDRRRAAAGNDNPDSMVEKVGRMIDRAEQAAENLSENSGEGGGDKPNPKKRMWEEEAAPQEEARARDEL